MPNSFISFVAFVTPCTLLDAAASIAATAAVRDINPRRVVRPCDLVIALVQECNAESMPALNQYAPDAVESPLMFQGWKLVTFLHWRYPIAQIRPLVPPDLELDLFDGSAWVGLVPFVVTQLRLPFIPALPWISQFPETNVRTYVRDRHGKASIWFFTLDAARLPAVLAARTFFRLPYRWARMRVDLRKDVIHYESVRRAPFGSAQNLASIGIRDAIA